MVARTLAIVILIVTLTLISDTRSTAAPAVELVYIVDSDQDDQDILHGDWKCLTSKNTCTLRAAIQEANSDGLPSRIKFASKMTISPELHDFDNYGYKLIEDYTVIDASDQWDGKWPWGEPGVSIRKFLYTSGLLWIRGDYAQVRGIEFTGQGTKGIVVDGSKGTRIGGIETGQRNVFSVFQDPSSSTAWGVEITGGSSKTDVRGNYFGTVDGLVAHITPGEYGIMMNMGDNLIRDNLIVGQSIAGIYSWQYGHNLIMDNIIGSNIDGNAIPNNIGIFLQQGSNETQIGPSNKIVYNILEGILIDRSYNNLVFGNDISFNGNHGVTIDGAVGNRIGLLSHNLIQSNSGHGVNITNSTNNQILFNQIGTNTQSGIYLENSSDNTIGSVLDFEGNGIDENGSHGIHLTTGSHNNTISGNYIGFSPYGPIDQGNGGHGVLVENGASNNQIGGLDPGKGNWFVYNDKDGIRISGSGTSGNIVEGNVIGADLYWNQKAPNKNHGIGIYNGASGNWIGWFNTILASGWSGVAIVNSDNNVVWLNNIGTDGADIHWGNSFYGVHVVNGSSNQIFGNGIHNNGLHDGEAGVLIDGAGSINNFISINSIHNNVGLGIELVNGGNSNQLAPIITGGSCNEPIMGTACPGCIVEIFSDTDNEGLLLEDRVNADPSTGAFSWSGSPAGPNITATASSTELGSTSQFSTPHPIGICNYPPTAAFTHSPTEVYTCNSAAFDASSSSDVEDPTSALQVRWDWENDGTYNTNFSLQKMAQHKFTSPGVHTVRLEVQDTGGLTDATTRQISVSACSRIYLPIIFR